MKDKMFQEEKEELFPIETKTEKQKTAFPIHLSLESVLLIGTFLFFLFLLPNH